MEINNSDNNFGAGLFVVGMMALVIWLGLSISAKVIWMPPAIFLAIAFGSGFLDTWDKLTSDDRG